MDQDLNGLFVLFRWTECFCGFQVLLVYKDKGFCGGVIYKPTWILTASHCLESYDAQFLKVVAGTNPSVCLGHGFDPV